MLNLLLQTNTNTNRRWFIAIFRHWGAFGLFFLAVLDSSPVPTFAGPDILIVILVNTHQLPWYIYALTAAAGSVVGAYLTFRLARKAGEAYLQQKFGQNRVATFIGIFQKSGTGTLIASSAIPFPFPTSLVFAAAGASDYPLAKFLTVVSISRAVRYAGLAIVASRYGRHFARVILHPTQYWGWFLLFTAIILVLIGAGILFNRRLSAAPAH